MFSDLLLNLLDPDEQIRIPAEQTIIQLRDENPEQYIQELINVIIPSFDEQNLIQLKIQHASIVLLGQIITHPDYIKNFDIDSSFFEQLSTLLLPKMNSENYDISYSSAVLFGESLGFLIRDQSHPGTFLQLIEILQSDINSITMNNPSEEDLRSLQFLLISVTSFINSTPLNDEQIISLFHALYQLFQTDYLTNEVLQAISSMTEEITNVFNQYSSFLTTESAQNNEYQSYVDLLFEFFNQLLEKTSTNEANKASFYNFFRLFFKHVSFSFFYDNLGKVLEIAYSDISTSMNESILLSSIHFLRTVLRREKKMKTTIGTNFPPFFNSSHFNLFIMPLIRVFSILPDDEDNLDLDYIEYWNPHTASQEMIAQFVDFFNEYSPKVLIPLISCLSSENCDPERSIMTKFSFFENDFEMDSFIAIETSLFLLCLIIQFSTNLPPTDFIITFIGTTLSSPSTRIRFASIRALNCYLKRELNTIENEAEFNEEEEEEEEGQIDGEINKEEEEEELIDVQKKLTLLIPVLIEHVLDEHPIISLYSIRCIYNFSEFQFYGDQFPTETIFPLFLNIIENCTDSFLVENAFEYLEKIVSNRKMKEVEPLLEPVIQLLSESNEQSTKINEYLRSLIVVIVEKMTISASQYHDIIYSLLTDGIEPQYLTYLSMFSKIFAFDFPQNFQQTFEIIMNFLTNSEEITDDVVYRNEVVYYCSTSILVLSAVKNFSENVENATSLLLDLLYKDNSNLNILIGLSGICMYHKNEIIELLPTLFQIVSQINILDLAENRMNDELNDFDDRIEVDDVICSIANIVIACYEVEPENQEIIDSIIEILQSINSIKKIESSTVLESAIDLLISLNYPLLFEVDKQMNITSDIIKKSDEFESKDLRDCVEQLKEKIKICYALAYDESGNEEES